MKTAVRLILLKTPPSPITGASSSVRHGDNLNGRIDHSVDHRLRKTPKMKFSRAVQMSRPTLRAAANLADGVVELGDERTGGDRVALEVPEEGGSGFRGSVPEKFNAWLSHGIV